MMAFSPRDVLDLPLPLTLPPALLATFSAIYAVAAPRFRTEKARAYILSSLSSWFMTIFSLPFVYKYVVYGLGTCFEEGQSGWMGQLGRVGVLFFGTYLFGERALSS
jgi:hypothetical protein